MPAYSFTLLLGIIAGCHAASHGSLNTADVISSPICECLSADKVTAALGTEFSLKLGANYGSKCASWDDGRCLPVASNNTGFRAHGCGTSATCSDMWGEIYDFNENQPWCCDSWCYVDQVACTGTTAEAYGISIYQSWTDAELYYSYDLCPDSYSKPSKYIYTPDIDYSQFQHHECPYVVTAHGCECTGNNSALGQNEIEIHGEDYGKWCAAWEDDVCTPSATGGPEHTCKGSNATDCAMHWPAYDFSVSQSWCCDAWCYIDPITCTPEIKAKYGIQVSQSWTKTDLYFSYEACADRFSAVKAVKDTSYAVANMAQYDPDTCPYTVGGSASRTRLTSVATGVMCVVVSVLVLLAY
mmetsp:Transcript_89831/g.131510  ORF Transcript_89831/g.131510 Transcript_89831/m.131510 type:complete len:355 (-) Transcript_89831:107-1171(-)